MLLIGEILAGLNNDFYITNVMVTFFRSQVTIAKITFV